MRGNTPQSGDRTSLSSISSLGEAKLLVRGCVPSSRGASKSWKTGIVTGRHGRMCDSCKQLRRQPKDWSMAERDCFVPTRHGEFSGEHSTIPDPVQHFLMCHVYFCVTFLFCMLLLFLRVFHFSFFSMSVTNNTCLTLFMFTRKINCRPVHLFFMFSCCILSFSTRARELTFDKKIWF